MPQQDPLISAWFSIEFQGQVTGAFRECTGLGSENEVVEYKASGQNGEFVIKKVPGRLKWNNIVLSRGITDSMDMWQWRKLIEQGNVNSARKNGTITMYNTQGAVVAKWNFINAWPSRITGPSANAGENGVAIEELEITHEGYERVS
jgi:phage tail-like protein